MEQISNPLGIANDGVTAITPSWPAMVVTLTKPNIVRGIPKSRLCVAQAIQEPERRLAVEQNYAACLGDATDWIDQGVIRHDGTNWVALTNESNAAHRGAFVPRRSMGLRDMLDGTANTLMVGEVSTDLGDLAITTTPSSGAGWDPGVHTNPGVCRTPTRIDANRPQFWVSGQTQGGTGDRRGFRWADARPLFTGITSILPPNTELCMGGGWTSWGAGSVSSRHQGGAHVVMGDGAVRFITDSIQAGSISAGTVINGGTGARAPGSQSPYGLWGSLGTRAGKETITQDF